MKKKVILFDLDGTLVNSKAGITKCVAYALEHFGIIEPDLNKLEMFIGPPLHQSFHDFYGFDEEKAKLATEKYRERYKEKGVLECEPYENIPQTMETLAKKGYHLAVATSKPEIFAKQIMDNHNLSQYFDTVTGSLLDNSRSDKASVIEECFRRLKIGEAYGNVYQKSEVLMVGDRKHDILGAKKMGIESMGVTFGFAEGNELVEAQADYIVERAEEIVSVLEMA